jgi:UDP-N-acetylmuramate dehydrogenase
VFRNPPGDYAGRLIEEAGLKGARVGGAMVSTKHANFILNDGTASATDIERLIERVRHEVAAKLGVLLVLEVRVLGERAEVPRGCE